MPKGIGFIDYPVFEQGYEALKHATKGFTLLDPEALLQKTFEAPVVILVLRTMLGFTPPEWAYLATLQTGVEVSTARDKATRIQHLGELSMAGQPPDTPKYEVIACIAGRGFGVRREDMKKILTATRGKVFTLRNLDRLIDCTNLKDYRTK